MTQLDAKLLVVLLVSLAVAAGAALWLAARYRKAMLRHMTAPPGDRSVAAESIASAVAAPTPLVAFDRKNNRRQNLKLAIVIIVISAIVAATTAVFELLVVHTTAGFGWHRWLLLSLTYAWPVVPSLGLLWRWPIGRTVLGACRT